MTNHDWMAQARCRADEAGWVSEVKPEPRRMAYLADVCSFCPVITTCTQYALDMNVAGGVYAGVWVPLHSTNSNSGKNWRAARAELARRLRAARCAN